MLKNTDPEFKQFGEIYFSTVYPGVIKGWHLHKVMTLNYVVIKGHIKLVLFDQKENSPTKGKIEEIFIGDKKYCLAKIPPGIVNGFKGIGKDKAIVANCTTHPYDPSEIIRIDPFTKKYPISGI